MDSVSFDVVENKYNQNRSSPQIVVSDILKSLSSEFPTLYVSLEELNILGQMVFNMSILGIKFYGNTIRKHKNRVFHLNNNYLLINLFECLLRIFKNQDPLTRCPAPPEGKSAFAFRGIFCRKLKNTLIQAPFTALYTVFYSPFTALYTAL